MSSAKTTTARVDCTFIRKSTAAQDESGQMSNVAAMLRDRGVYVPDERIFVGTVSRSKVKANPQFARLMELVERDKVATVYVESQDRWGTADRPELFTLLGILRSHGTRLFDLRAGKDLTERDLATEMMAFINSVKSEKELQDLAYRSLRSRVQNLKDSGSWPTGQHPYGFGKSCYSPDGKLLWSWIPVSRTRGRLYTPDTGGKLHAGPDDVPIPRKARGTRLVLVPGRPESVEAVRLVYDFYVRVGLSRRQVAARLNSGGHTINGGPFTHTVITHILVNPAYIGDTHFGKMLTGTYHTFDAAGIVVEQRDRPDGKRKRAVENRIVREGTHEPIIDRVTWDLAQEKLAGEKERTSFSPRNPDYYLKQILVCGHCGKGMIGRTETDHQTGEKSKVVYVCSTYQKGKCNAHESPCGQHRITHADAERLLLDKLAELNRPLDLSASEGARANLQERLSRLGHDDDEDMARWELWVMEGIDAFAEYVIEQGVDYPELPRLRKRAKDFYCGDDWAGLRDEILKVERIAVEQARRKLDGLTEEHAAAVRNWSKASEMMQTVLRADIDRLEAEIAAWKPRTLPLSQRLETLYAAENERQGERERLLAEYPTLDSRERGEALRRLFRKVSLFWEATFHPPTAKTYRPRKTNRAGRNRYTLQRDKVVWDFAVSDLDTTSARTEAE